MSHFLRSLRFHHHARFADQVSIAADRSIDPSEVGQLTACQAGGEAAVVPPTTAILHCTVTWTVVRAVRTELHAVCISISPVGTSDLSGVLQSVASVTAESKNGQASMHKS